MSVKEEALKLQKSIDSLYDAGKKAEWNTFWDNFQDYGKRTAYTYAFANYNFASTSFYPKYDITVTSYQTNIFYNFSKGARFSLKQRLEECGVTLDTSGATNIGSMFSYANRFTEIPTIDCTGLTGNSTSVFSNLYGYCKTYEKIITKESVTYTTWFKETNPTNITFEGVIGRSIDFSYSTDITVASMKNIISCLKNYSGTDSEFTYQIVFAEDRWTALEADSTAPDGNTWRNYVGTLGWNT